MFFNVDGIAIDFEAQANNSNLYRFIEAFRKHGHKCSRINPVPIKTLQKYVFMMVFELSINLFEIAVHSREK